MQTVVEYSVTPIEGYVISGDRLKYIIRWSAYRPSEDTFQGYKYILSNISSRTGLEWPTNDKKLVEAEDWQINPKTLVTNPRLYNKRKGTATANTTRKVSQSDQNETNNNTFC